MGAGEKPVSDSVDGWTNMISGFQPTREELGMSDKWDERFMALAEFVSKWSKDPDVQVGAVISQGRRVVSMGFNGFPMGVADTSRRLEDKSVKRSLVVHAEVNAIVFAGRLPECSVMHASRFPCTDCAKLIIQSGVYRVTSRPLPTEGHWAADSQISLAMLTEAGVDVAILEERV